MRKILFAIATIVAGVFCTGCNDGKSYAVTSGLKDGDHVIVEGVGVSVRDGVKIQPVDKTNSQNAAEAK